MTTHVGTENKLLLMGSEWGPGEGEGTPPVGSVVGVWPVERDGEVGRFRGNPHYRLANENSRPDPLNAVLTRGAALEEQLLRDALLDLAMNGDGRPPVLPSPGEVSCVMVGTAERHRERVHSPQWCRIDLDELAGMLANDTDVLSNSVGPASVRWRATS